jgi:NADPH:quinone reductase-like Zn-dependent oxidoreductase
VLGAAGGTGLAAVQLGKALGARVIAVASGAAKLAAATAAGADLVIDHRATDFVAATLAATGDRGVDVIHDPVGDTLPRCGRRLAAGDRLRAIPRSLKLRVPAQHRAGRAALGRVSSTTGARAPPLRWSSCGRRDQAGQTRTLFHRAADASTRSLPAA